MASRTHTPVLAAILSGSVLAVIWFGCGPSEPLGSPGAGYKAGQAADPVGSGPAVAPSVPGGPQVEVEVQARYALQPPLSLPVTVRRGQRVLPAHVQVVGGVGSQWPEADVRPGRALLRIEHAEDVWFRVVRFHVPGSSVDVSVGAAVPIRGRVVDVEQRPVQGAEVWCGGSLQGLAVTDENGVFEALVDAGSGIPVVVMADGFAWSSKIVDWQFDDGSRIAFQLSAEGRLRVQLNAIVAGESTLRGATASVEPLDAGNTSQLAFPFFARQLFYQDQLDARGSVLLRGLPSRSTVGVVVRGPGLLTTRVVAAKLRLGEQKVLVPGIVRPRMHGRVVDQAGEPVADVALWSWPARGKACTLPEDRWLLPPATAVGAVTAVTAADGSFAMAKPEGRQFALALRGPDGTHARLLRETDLIEPLELVLPAWRAGAVELIVPPPLDGAPWRVRVVPFASSLREVGANDSFTCLLPGPQVADLRVRVGSAAGEWSEPKVLRNVVLLGSWSLPASLLAR